MLTEHPAALDINLLLRQCTTRRTRRSGPGGQHRNKVETAFVIEHTPTGVIAEANERRSLEENRQMAIFRLRVRLAALVRQSVAREMAPSELWRRRCGGGKRISVSDQHEDFPALLAEAMDRLAIFEYQTADAARALGISTTSLINLIAKSTEAFTALCRERALRKMPKLQVDA